MVLVKYYLIVSALISCNNSSVMNAMHFKWRGSGGSHTESVIGVRRRVVDSCTQESFSSRVAHVMVYSVVKVRFNSQLNLISGGSV